MIEPMAERDIRQRDAAFTEAQIAKSPYYAQKDRRVLLAEIDCLRHGGLEGDGLLQYMGYLRDALTWCLKNGAMFDEHRFNGVVMWREEMVTAEIPEVLRQTIENACRTLMEVRSTS